MTGEHFSSSTGKDLDKKKDAYVRFRWETKKGDKRPKQTILEKEKVLENKNLADWIDHQHSRKPESCVCCEKPAAWPLVKVEYYNWKQPGVESEVFAHEECLKRMAIGSVLEGLRLMGKNPTVFLELNCLSFDKCRFWDKGTDFRNCQHIVLRFDQVREDNHDGTVSLHFSPLLYCKRAHPGEFPLASEAETLWNVEQAGSAIMLNRLAEQVDTPQLRTQIETLKQQNPTIVQEIRKALDANPGIFMLAGPLGMYLGNVFAEPSPQEKWEEIQEGNDVY